MTRFQTTAERLVVILVPLFLIMTSVRLLLTPLFLEIEYRMPGFPADEYGFNMDDRLYWSRLAVDYLLNDEEIAFLANLQFPDGRPLFNQRELRHMYDVKILVQQTITVWNIIILILLATGLWARGRRWLPAYWRALAKGGWLTVGVIAAILLSVALSFNALFTLFHRLFFEGDTWIFARSDTLIRLFPLRFWQDAFILLGVLSLAGAAIFIWLGKKLAHKQ